MVFQTVLAVQEVRFFSFRFVIIPCKKLYRKQSVEFLIAEHIFLKNSHLTFLKSSFVKAGLYCNSLELNTWYLYFYVFI